MYVEGHPMHLIKLSRKLVKIRKKKIEKRTNKIVHSICQIVPSEIDWDFLYGISYLIWASISIGNQPNDVLLQLLFASFLRTFCYS